MPTHDEVQRLIEAAGGTVTEHGTVLPDGSSFTVASFPLPKDHWAYAPIEPPPMPLRVGTDEFMDVRFKGEDHVHRLTRQDLAARITLAARYAYQASTESGKEQDLDPDALVQNFIVGVLGYWTPDGWSRDESQNP